MSHPRNSKALFAFFFFTLHLLLHSTPITSEEVEDESEFSYEEDSDKGPSRWGAIHREWYLCRNGTMQSPIDLLDERVEVLSHFSSLRRSYVPSNATLKNRGHDIVLRWEAGGGSMDINGTHHVLQQCHWHSPSEHTVNGKRFDLEVHLVHESPTGHVAVIGMMYKIGDPDPFLSSMMNPLQAIVDDNMAERRVGMVDPKHVGVDSSKYYTYVGSLTTPPCTQNVAWTIVHKVKTVSREQINLLREAVKDDAEANARPIQPINRRPIKLFHQEENEREEDP